MLRKYAALSLALAAGILAACGGGHGLSPNAGMGGGTSYVLPPIGDLAIDATLPKHAIGETLPTTLGKIKMKRMDNAVVGGFTQSHYSQTLAFPPGTKITIHNVSKTDEHTFNVIKEIVGNRVHFPNNPTLQVTAQGGNRVEAGFASGPIKPGHSISVVLAKAGTYLVGCAFHYKSNGMRDILVVKAGAKPGPQATPPSNGGGGGPTPTPPGSGGGWNPVH
jgi:plastocyanin